MGTVVPRTAPPHTGGVKRVLVVVAVTAFAVLAAGLYLFEPWRLLTSSTVDEALPVSEPAAGTQAPASAPADAPDAPTVPAPAQDQVLARGTFEDAEHGTSGTARILQLADGRRFLRLEALATSDGPDLHVWISDQPSGGEWGSYDDGRYVRLGDLKATNGNQNYEIPAETDLDDLTSVVIWCDRFNVAFGTAPVAL